MARALPFLLHGYDQGRALPNSRKNRVEECANLRDNERMNDYERVAKIIRFLDVQHVQQPNLDNLAGRAGLSRYHFHRLFSRWAGVTPKDFLQCLTVAHARQRLQCGECAGGRAGCGTVVSGPIARPVRDPLEAATPGKSRRVEKAGPLNLASPKARLASAAWVWGRAAFAINLC
jgi:AraC-like DNA-binding protein